MKPSDYTKQVLEKIDENREITCEDCGEKDCLGHALIDHETGTVKMVCHNCFVNKYQEFLYSGKGKRV